MGRFIIRKNINTTTEISDKKSGRQIFATQDNRIKEYSVLRVIVTVLVLCAYAAAIFISFRADKNKERKLKAREKELKKLEKQYKNIDAKK